MKQATLLVVLLAMTSLSFASKGENSRAPISSGDTSFSATITMQDMLQQIKNVAAVNEGIEIKEANVLNIEATIRHKKKYILYNSSFISSLYTASKDKWSVIALIVHEMGHHMMGHTGRRGGSKPGLELEADEFAGTILYKLGATLEQSQNVMYFIAKKEGSKTHPGRDARLSAIEKGWRKSAASHAATVKASS